ncbi:adenosylhomocysteine nucleosidase [Allocatelliglobosispora scoriae]|uniref:Adenosylhomocysteine nucleosidase n=1 Tax=Allocatelliglobosispora scoriae TaxID=643052 RepID=A0A841BS20_9ACTN|nr:nucleosidase [Allocatelliglobosispora scoriae]MBB5870198.1 adenosylhomocysteine nucleosidase [Allocatelliglobosispora scoriae]
MLLTGAVRADRPLIVVALPEEAAHLRTDLPILLTGVGKVEAATAVASLLASGPRPKEIINLGTAGALRAGLTGTFEVSKVIQHDFNSAALLAVTGHLFGTPLELVGPGLVLATGDVFVSDPVLKDALAEQADLVDMEGYAVASAAAAHGVPVRMIKHVSDDAGEGAGASWPTTVDACARELAAWLAGHPESAA